MKKRFSVLGLRRPRSSPSYEVELSDNWNLGTQSFGDSSTSSSCTSEELEGKDIKHATSSNSSYTTYTSDSTERSSKKEQRIVEIGDGEEDDGNEDEDEVSSLPDRFQSRPKPQRKMSDLSNFMSSQVSGFLSAVDNTVDKVVDTLIPPKETQEATRTKKHFFAHAALKKSFRSSRRKKNSNLVHGKKEGDDESFSSSNTSFSITYICTRLKERDNVGRNDDLSSISLSSLSSFRSSFSTESFPAKEHEEQRNGGNDDSSCTG